MGLENVSNYTINLSNLTLGRPFNRIGEECAAQLAEVSRVSFLQGIAIGASLGLIIAAVLLLVYFFVQKRNPEEKKKNRLKRRSPW
jgi:hypothetical protein